MTREEKELALYCLKASSDYHSEVCEECIKYPNCDHTGQDDVTETIIKALEQESCADIAQERYKDLCEYFGGAKDILKSRKDFKAWLGRVKWHIRKAEELYEKYEYKQEPILDKIRAEIECLTITKGGEDYIRKMAELYSLKIKVLQIIDKYKAESEDKE